MLVRPGRKLATYEDLLELPEGARAEISRGEIVTLPAPRPRHSKAQRALGHFVGGPFDDEDGAGGPGGWWIFVEVEIRFELHEVVRPDLSGWRDWPLRSPFVGRRRRTRGARQKEAPDGDLDFLERWDARDVRLAKRARSVRR